MPEAIFSDKAPKPNGNYSHVIRAGGLLHVCGWMGDVPETGDIIEGGVEAQTEQAMKNIGACLAAAGSSLDKIVRRRIYTMDMAYLPTIQEVTKRYLSEPWPVSTAVQISGLAKKGALVEIEVIAEA
ncbi:hypothetical protein LTR36_004787 [Oleoguttula mirabilis]|uniref:Uncharacterized protein n=1 Tax=Oleoguttula mirabilis TaxID=1507867 RepID=A0AAV9JFV8_9PEZI|nr:hypothetical protein LTR36_004787 [Oleoguttula mirabilis]